MVEVVIEGVISLKLCNYWPPNNSNSDDHEMFLLQAYSNEIYVPHDGHHKPHRAGPSAMAKFLE